MLKEKTPISKKKYKKKPTQSRQNVNMKNVKLAYN